MTTDVNKYRVWCETESAYVYTWDTVEPTVCPTDSGHTINTSLNTVVETVGTTTVTASEDSNGYFLSETITIDIPTGTPGDVTEHDVVWPMPIKLWRSLLIPADNLIGDVINVMASPETTVGVLTAPVIIGDRTINVNSTVTDNVWRGFLITIDDTVNKNVCGRVTNVDKVGGTITFETATTNAFAAGVPVKISIYILKSLKILNNETMDIGLKGIKGKRIDVGTILRIYYTNNSGTSKELNWRIEVYSNEY
jgi:hypothetical protein